MQLQRQPIERDVGSCRRTLLLYAIIIIIFCTR